MAALATAQQPQQSSMMYTYAAITAIRKRGPTKKMKTKKKGPHKIMDQMMFHGSTTSNWNGIYNHQNSGKSKRFRIAPN